MADILVCAKEYPHTDFMECSEKLLNLVAVPYRSEIWSAKAFNNCGMTNVYYSTRSLMIEYAVRMHALKRTAGIQSVSLPRGYSWCDAPEPGTRRFANPGKDKTRAACVSRDLRCRLRALRETTMSLPILMDTSIDEAVRAKKQQRWLISQTMRTTARRTTQPSYFQRPWSAVQTRHVLDRSGIRRLCTCALQPVRA